MGRKELRRIDWARCGDDLDREEQIAKTAIRLMEHPPLLTWGLDDWARASDITDLGILSAVICDVETLTGRDYGSVLDQIAERESGVSN